MEGEFKFHVLTVWKIREKRKSPTNHEIERIITNRTDNNRQPTIDKQHNTHNNKGLEVGEQVIISVDAGIEEGMAVNPGEG